MYCRTYRCTMDSKHCLEYQARAQGVAKMKNGAKPPASILGRWALQHKPCLDCAQGKEIASTGGHDHDMEALLSQKTAAAPPTKHCPSCNHDYPLTGDYWYRNRNRLDGWQRVCKKCQAKFQRNSYYKLRGKDMPPETQPAAVVLDFLDFPELLEQIAADAKRNFRTVANEILFRVANYANS